MSITAITRGRRMGSYRRFNALSPDEVADAIACGKALAAARNFKPETYPQTIHTLPTTVAGHDVLAWATLENSTGSYPGGIVLAHSSNPKDSQPYVTWVAYTRDGGETWSACWGHPFSHHIDAREDFFARCHENRLATEALTEPF